MNKKTIRIVALIGLAIVLIALLWPPKVPKMGNRFEMDVPDENAESASDGVSSVSLYMDVSGSMRGFVDFAGLPTPPIDAASMKTTVTKFLDNVDACFTAPTCYYGNKTVNKDEFRKNLQNSNVFREAETEVDKMIDKMIQSYKSGNVSLLVSDMMLSFEKEVLIKNPWYTVSHLQDLEANVHASMTTAKMTGLHVMMVQYLSSFNGKYYYNCTENRILPQGYTYKDSLMLRRPYYILAVGEEQSLRSLLAKNCFDNSYVSIYSTFDMADRTTQPFTVDVSGTTWAIGIDSDYEGAIYSNAKGAASETMSFYCDKFYLPKYAASDFSMVLPVIPEESQGIISAVTQSEKGKQLVYQVTLKEYDRISVPKNGQVASFNLIANPGTAMAQSNLNKDVSEPGAPLISMTDLEGKTFSIGATLKAINEVYFEAQNRPDINIGTVSFRIYKIK